jgi:transposase InsO family protein
MKLEINSVWKVSGIDGISEGLYRIIAILAKIESLILFELTDGDDLRRPVICHLLDFQSGIRSKEVQLSSFPIPDYQLIAEDCIPESYKIKRDKRYNLIKELVMNHTLLFDLATQKRIKFLSEYAQSLGVDALVIYRNLNLYWKFGLDKNALLPAYKRSGGRGKNRVSGKVKRGKPVVSKTGAFKLSEGINVTEQDKEKILKGLKRFYLSESDVTLKKAYDETLCEYYAVEAERAEIERDYAKVPSYWQFLYWKEQLLTHHEVIKKRTTENDYLRNKRGVLGSATENTPVPGSCFEIDATVADVHVVSAFNRSHAIGRPTLYVVIDKASRMIVGLHVSMEYASWTAARQALVNSFLPKAAYCARYGIELSDADWPCSHIPQQLTCDRGEMICSKPEELVVPLMQLNIAPPYRPDWKGIVERRFDILNEELLHQLIGTTRGKQIVRADQDPRQRAMYTLDEITAMLIDEVLLHNGSIFDELAISSRLLIENDLAPTPLNFWNIHIAKHRHALKKADEVEVRAKLLPATEVSMTRNGILFEEMYYSCERIEKEAWASQARINGRWRLEARVDQDNTSFIYVRLNPDEGFTKCEMLPRTSLFKDLPLADVCYFQDWKKSKGQKQPVTMASVAAHQRKKEIERYAKKESSNAPPLNSRAEKVADMRSRRRQEIMAGKERCQPDGYMSKTAIETERQDKTVRRLGNSRIISLLKRDRDEK